MGGGDYEDPYRDFKPKQNSRPRLTSQPNNETTLARDVQPLESWGFKSFYDIAVPVHTMTTAPASEIGTQWVALSESLVRKKDEFISAMGSVNHWQGEGRDAADMASKAYGESLHNLAARVSTMANAINHAIETVDVLKANIPSEAEFNKALADADADEAQVESARETMAIFARTQMTTTYNPGITESAAAVPAFASPNQPSGAPQGPAPTGGGPSGTGGGGAGVGAGGGGAGGGGSANTAQANKGLEDSLKNYQDNLKSLQPQTDPSKAFDPSSLTNGMQQLSGMGSSGIQQAQSAAQQALSKLGQNPLGQIPAAQALQRGLTDAKKALSGLGGGASGGKGGGGAGSGGGGAAALNKGLNSLSPLAKEGELAKNLKGIANAERLASRATASPTGGGPMGGGGGAGAGGRGGEDKEHKANKFLQTTRNGEEILATPLVAVAPVIKE